MEGYGYEININLKRPERKGERESGKHYSKLRRSYNFNYAGKTLLNGRVK